jgi:hypothetical protein
MIPNIPGGYVVGPIDVVAKEVAKEPEEVEQDGLIL